MATGLASIRDLPIAFWVILLAAGYFVFEYVQLRLRVRASRPRSLDAERRLERVAGALRRYANENLQRLPDSLDEVGVDGREAVTYRPITRLNLDPKLILVHDREPTQKVIEFPALRDGRGVVFSSGRLLVVSEEVFDKLLAADDALRARLGLAEARAGIATPEDEIDGQEG